MSVIVERQNLAITVGYGYDETTCLLKPKIYNGKYNLPGDIVFSNVCVSVVIGSVGIVRYSSHLNSINLGVSA